MATSNDHTNTKSSDSHTLLLRLLLIFFSFILFIGLTIPMTHHHQSTSTVAPFKRVLLKSSAPVSSTIDLRPKAHPRSSHTSRKKEFGNDAHEVPSGPNPISN
ncbi:unnamed protein product [Eruca vesicaria subsp. sativa]|uniref:CLAVATA3/ESR (CLE)-related protein 44 n=1 Tax=Eruca vesicaria subsp. sativa TaxID=29727 RepID=A0ABC8INT1_ERUVS|nr:unnamed protein product [Eruca vesicaria subsp. sativa]